VLTRAVYCILRHLLNVISQEIFTVGVTYWGKRRRRNQELCSVLINLQKEPWSCMLSQQVFHLNMRNKIFRYVSAYLQVEWLTWKDCFLAVKKKYTDNAETVSEVLQC